jgi:AcrR family transcriptional regulator
MSGIRESKKRRTREAIMAAAMRLFAEDGYERTSMEMLAREAGIGKGTIYGYFPTKDSIFLAYCEEEIDFAFAALERLSDPAAPLLEQLLTLFTSQFAFVTRNPEFGRHLVREMAFPRPAAQEASRQLDGRYIAGVGALLEAARQRGELKEECDIFLATVHFYSLYLVALSGWYGGYTRTPEEVEGSLRALFIQAFNGLGREPLAEGADAGLIARLKHPFTGP